MIKTLPLEELKKKTSTIYEAVEAISKRARQINSMRNAQIPFYDNLDDTDDLFEEINFETRTQVFEKKEKPVHQSIRELMEDKLEIKYPEKEKKEKQKNNEHPAK
ncbi:MAG TPA: DNA-directed RNA polymerase subunit omega [Bacteroidetes bacterium]|nr:DNA-directed RNA polymerase subunit omega [Bacteroidota bacterium]